MSAARFYSMRSCNDDYVPFTCQPNEFKNTNIIFPLIKTDSRFEPDAKLEALDAKLEAMCAEIENSLNGSEDDIVRPDFDNDADMIFEYAKQHEISILDATDYLKSCHYCGNTDIPFGQEYCNPRCQEYAVDFNYMCFRGADCKTCDNYWYQESCKKAREYLERNLYEDDEDDYEEEEYLIYDDIGDMTPRGIYKEDEPEICSECQLITKIIAYGWRNENDNLCIDCVNLPGMDAYEC